MRKICLWIMLLPLLVRPVWALDLTAPEVPGVEQHGAESFTEDLMTILQDALDRLAPDLGEAAAACGGVLAVGLGLSVLAQFPGKSRRAVELAGALAVAGLLLGPANGLIALGVETVTELSEYEKLLLPVMTAALAAQGGVNASAALYAGTAAFNALLSSFISKILVPGVRIYLALSVACAAAGEGLVKKCRDQAASAAAWGLKTILYVYTGYISITGVVSGTTDASVLKAAKLTISGAVPVVGSILSDASEAVLVSAAAVKNAAGIYGLLAILSLWVGPFLRIGAHYLMLKATAAVSSIFGVEGVSGLAGDFARAMGLLLAMTGAVCLMLVISTVCFMKGVGG